MRTITYLILIYTLFASCTSDLSNTDKQNILFIAIDDLRVFESDSLDQKPITPNLDGFKLQAIDFQNAFAQEPTCGPSRASILTGLRPESTQVFDIFTPIREVKPNVLTLPEHFRNNGYKTLSLGKIYHHKDEDDNKGWSQPAWKANLNNIRGYLNQENIAKMLEGGNSTYYEATEVPDSAYEDGMTANEAVRMLKYWKKSDNPFFLAVGFFKPHLPFIAPKKYWDLYDSSDIKIPEHYTKPMDRNMSMAYNWGGEINSYLGAETIHDTVRIRTKDGAEEIDYTVKFDTATAKKLIHGYYAATSYADAQLGKVLDELNRLGLADNTHVIIWSDHGWLLGEIGEWCKHGLYDNQTRATLTIKPAGFDKNIQTDALVEMVDIFPTTCDLAGLPIPEAKEGKSLVALVDDHTIDFKDAVYTQYVRNDSWSFDTLKEKYYQGYTVRTNDYRYIEWRLSADMDSIVSREFYDYRINPIELENKIDDATYQREISKHRSLIENHFTENSPNSRYGY